MKRLLGNLDGTDLGTICIYFAVLFAVGIWSSCRNRGSVGGYFLAGRSMNWLPVGASIFASNIGSGHFIGLAGSGASSGIAIAIFEFNAIFVLALLGWIFLPVYIVSNIITVPEYIKKRLGGQRIRIYLSVVTLLLYIFTKISADLYAGGIFIQQSIKISIYPAVIILLVISALFTIMGGLTAVIWTDFAQTIIILIGALYLMIRSFQITGGFDELVKNYFNGIPDTTRVYQSTEFTYNNKLNLTNLRPDLYGTTQDRNYILELNNKSNSNLEMGIYAECMIPASDALNFVQSINSMNLPWVGAFFGLTINATWYWCTDQVIVQRTLAAKNITHAKAGIILAALLKMTPMWLMIIPGMAARVLFTDTVTCGSAIKCTEVCQKAVGCSDIAYSSLVLNLLPSGARGLMVAVMMASLVSSLTSIFNSTSTIFTNDLWKLYRPHCKDAELMIAGRVVVLILVGIGIAWIPIVQLSDELFEYIQSVTGYLAPPICAINVLAILWRRTNELACFITLICGFIIGMIRFGWEIGYGKTPCGQEPLIPPHFLIKVHFLHFSILLFAMSVFIAVTVTLMTPSIPDVFTRRLVYSERHTAFNLTLDGPKMKIVSQHEKDLWMAEGPPREQNLPWYRKSINWLCGVENMQDQREPVFTQKEADDAMIEVKRQLSIDETPRDRILTTTGMGIVLGITVFIYGFFA